MSAHLPADLEQFVQAEVRSERFKSSEEAITAACDCSVSKRKTRKHAS